MLDPESLKLIERGQEDPTIITPSYGSERQLVAFTIDQWSSVVKALNLLEIITP